MSPALLAGLAMRVVPAAAVQPLAVALLRAVLRAYPRVTERLDGFAGRTVLLDPTDLPYAFLLRLDADRPRTTAIDAASSLDEPDATVAGPLAALVALFEGREDGDALLFSRRIQVTGDTEVTLALRNAVDDCEIDIQEALLRPLGPFGRLARPPASAARRLLTRMSQDMAVLERAIRGPLQARLDAQALELARCVERIEELEAGRRKRRATARRAREPAA